MIIQYSIKQLGKKRPQIKKQPLELPHFDPQGQATLQDFITALVQQQVKAYATRQETTLLEALTPNQIEEGAAQGKVDVQERFEAGRVEVETAVETALQAFKDGLYAVFADEEQLEQLEQSINWSTIECFTFIRLTFLAGSYW